MAALNTLYDAARASEKTSRRLFAGLQSSPSRDLTAAPVRAPQNGGAGTSDDSTLLLDMGEFRFLDFPELQLHAQAGSAALRGVHLMQILPEPLAQRAGLFPTLPSMHQVCTVAFQECICRWLCRHQASLLIDFKLGQKLVNRYRRFNTGRVGIQIASGLFSIWLRSGMY